MSKARLSYLFGMRALFLPPRKKEKKKDQPLHELSQTRMSWPRSQIVCSAVFLTSKHSVFLHKGFHGHVEFLMQKKVGETETLFLTEWVIGKKKKVGGKEKKKTLLACPLSSSQPLKPKIKHGGSVNGLELPCEMPVLKESFWCVCQMPFPPTKKDNCFVTKLAEYFCLS